MVQADIRRRRHIMASLLALLLPVDLTLDSFTIRGVANGWKQRSDALYELDTKRAQIGKLQLEP